MSYVLAYEITALLFLLVVVGRFFDVRRFPNLQNRLFGLILIIAVADISLDILGSITIEQVAALPRWVNYAVNIPFYSLQIILPVLMAIYVLSIADELRNHERRILMLLPWAICQLMLMTTPWLKLIVSVENVDGVLTYARGPWFNILFMGEAFYLAVTVWLVIRFRRKLQRRQFITILVFIFIVVVATLIQLLHPRYLLTGVAISLAILMMFFTLQNPEEQLDLISGVFNYTALIGFLSSRLSQRKDLRLIALDVGGVRRLNSSFGVARGNMALNQVGQFLNSLNGKSWVFRLIGTRFLLVVEDEGIYWQDLRLIEERFKKVWRLDDVTCVLSATIRHFQGEPGFFETPERVIDLVDVAYSSLHVENWGDCQPIEADLLYHSQRAQAVEEALRRALADGQGLELLYQPLYCPEKGCYPSAEALLRLTDPELGSIPPAEFIIIAEKSGLIFQVDEWVTRETCSFLRRHQGELTGLSYVEVNLSAAEFIRPQFYERIKTWLDADVDPSQLCFELTETAATIYHDLLNEFMLRMNEDGFHFALDDFGIGYANLIQVVSLPFTGIKLDRSLLIAEGSKAEQILSGLLRTFNHLGLDTVVEGVETEEQARRCLDLGAGLIQGFHYSYPLSEGEFLLFLQEKNSVG